MCVMGGRGLIRYTSEKGGNCQTKQHIKIIVTTYVLYFLD